jgi:hypothetical protein
MQLRYMTKGNLMVMTSKLNLTYDHLMHLDCNLDRQQKET